MKKYKPLLIILIVFLFSCGRENKKQTETSIKIDTIYYGSTLNTIFEDKVGPFDIVQLNDYPFVRLYEDSIFVVKATTGKQKGLKVTLKTDRDNIEIGEGDSLNHFIIKTKKFIKEHEWVSLYLITDTTVNKLAIIYASLEKDGSYKNLHTYSDTLKTITIKNHKK